jgi:hypothetical protein
MIYKHPLKTSVGLIVALALLVGFGPREARADLISPPMQRSKRHMLTHHLGQSTIGIQPGQESPVLVLIHQTTQRLGDV